MEIDCGKYKSSRWKRTFVLRSARGQQVQPRKHSEVPQNSESASDYVRSPIVLSASCACTRRGNEAMGSHCAFLTAPNIRAAIAGMHCKMLGFISSWLLRRRCGPALRRRCFPCSW